MTDKPANFCVIVYYSKKMEPVKVSRCSDEVKAKDLVLKSILSGTHAAIIDSGLTNSESTQLYQAIKEHYSIETRKISPPQRKVVIKTREEGEHIIRTARARFAK